ncbi:MAG TPA: helix-turn-helix transcriptional regulator [Desertimonas sp.]|nr:helix-turn-helix transcriptional regulator [Desertimonas sp.]
MLQATRSPLRPSPVGTLLKEWREDRRRSQLDLALDVGVSTRHLSFVETGKARPSPELVLALAEHLDVPLCERNTLLLAAGYAPRYHHTPLDSEAMASVRAALGQLIRAHDPYPATVVDRHWNLVMANEGALTLVSGIAAHLLAPPLNTYRAALHPDGMAPLIENLAEWSHHLLVTLDRQVAATRDPELRALLNEVAAYPNIAALDTTWRIRSNVPTVVTPLRLRVGDAMQSWFSTNMLIGTPADITLDELHIELFHPADAATAAAVGR